MKKQIRFSIILTVVMILSLILASGAAAKSNNKATICHSNGDGSFVLLKVKGNTLRDHLTHGDAAPGEAVPGQPGMIFAADCTVASTTPNEQAQTPSLQSNNGKKADKVYVCHRRGNGTFILININGNALPAHLEHGDKLPAGTVTNPKLKKLGIVCEVAQEELVQSLSVDSASVDAEKHFIPVSSNPLENGQLYEIRVSGTYIFDTFNHQADAEYAQNASAEWIKGDTEWASPNLLDLSINDCTTNRDWGAYQATHIYKMQWTGTGTPLSFCINDTYYADNKGALTVEIWKINW